MLLLRRKSTVESVRERNGGKMEDIIMKSLVGMNYKSCFGLIVHMEQAEVDNKEINIENDAQTEIEDLTFNITRKNEI